MRVKFVAVFILALLLRLGLAAAWYTPDLSKFQTGDYTLYHIGAAHFIEHGDFSNSLFLVRPPVFPLVVAALGVNHQAVLWFDVIVGALIAPLTVLLARRFNLSETMALLAGIIVALDPGSMIYSTFLGPEPLANLLLLLGVLTLLASLNQSKYAPLYALAAGGLLALSSLTRPATYLLWIVLGGWLLISRRERWRSIALFALVNLVAVAGWMQHNYVQFGNRTFSTIGVYTLVYYRAASVERIATGADIDDVFLSINQRVEAELGHDPSLADGGTQTGYYAATHEISRALQTVAFDIIKTYPHIYIATLPVAFARIYGLVPSVSIFDGLLAWIDTAWNAALLLGALAGLWLAFRHKNWLMFWLALLVSAYYTGGIMLVKSAALGTRERSMLTPFMAVACAYAASYVWREWGVKILNAKRQRREDAKV